MNLGVAIVKGEAKNIAALLEPTVNEIELTNVLKPVETGKIDTTKAINLKQSNIIEGIEEIEEIPEEIIRQAKPLTKTQVRSVITAIKNISKDLGERIESWINGNKTLRTTVLIIGGLLTAPILGLLGYTVYRLIKYITDAEINDFKAHSPKTYKDYDELYSDYMNFLEFIGEHMGKFKVLPTEEEMYKLYFKK